MLTVAALHRFLQGQIDNKLGDEEVIVAYNSESDETEIFSEAENHNITVGYDKEKGEVFIEIEGQL